MKGFLQISPYKFYTNDKEAFWEIDGKENFKITQLRYGDKRFIEKGKILEIFDESIEEARRCKEKADVRGSVRDSKRFATCYNILKGVRKRFEEE